MIDTGEHTITLVLVHDQSRFYSSRLLVGVGNHTADEVGLRLVEGGHQVVQLALEVGRDSFPTLAFLPLLVLGCFQGLEMKRGVSMIDSSFNLYLKCYCTSIGKTSLSKETRIQFIAKRI